MATLKGRAVVTNANGVTLSGGIVSADSAHFNQSFRGTLSGDTKFINDANGDPVSALYHADMKTITLTVIPCALSATNTMTGARAALAAWTALTRGLKCTAIDSDNTAWDGDYNINSVTENRINADAVAVDIELHKGVANDLTLTPGA